VRRVLARAGSLRAEALGVAVVYGIYETSRGLLAGNASTAIHHATDIAGLERSFHVFIEPDLQRAVHAVPGMLGVFGALYLTLHLALTGGYLLWLYRHRPAAYARVRTTLLLATLASLVVFTLYPTAPPRIADLGIADTISGAHFDLNHGFVSTFYNPFAAVPSLHFGYALVVGASLVREARAPIARLAGLGYPALVLLIILATGNHFLFAAVAGALVVGAAALGAAVLIRGVRTSGVVRAHANTVSSPTHRTAARNGPTVGSHSAQDGRRPCVSRSAPCSARARPTSDVANHFHGEAGPRGVAGRSGTG